MKYSLVLLNMFTIRVRIENSFRYRIRQKSIWNSRCDSVCSKYSLSLHKWFVLFRNIIVFTTIAMKLLKGTDQFNPGNLMSELRFRRNPSLFFLGTPYLYEFVVYAYVDFYRDINTGLDLL
ncbi:unnamed protein product [Xylocopa violacea]|uniref:Uncharacterized protein n=1 Tax=Xylocopa violacea TaxID=135666 RepID=A0ABP1NFU7_XYLVO